MTDGNGSILTESIVRSLARTEIKLQKLKKDSAAALNAHHKRIKTLGIDVKNFLTIFDLIASHDDGQAYMENLREQRRIAQMLDIPVGHQFSFIDEIDAEATAKRDLGDKAYRMGAIAHLAGVEESACPHPMNSKEGQEWLRGYRYSADLCGDGDRELKAFEENAPAPDEAAENTMPAEPTKTGKGRKKQDTDEQPPVH